MGGQLSKVSNALGMKQLIDKAGLPLQVDEDAEVDKDLQNPGKPPPPSPYTQTYDERHWFTGIRSAVTVPASPLAVYDSLSRDLHHVFQPMTECVDEIEADDGQGRQEIFRVVRIPFRVAFVTGNLKLRLGVTQDRKAGEIHFEGLKEGRLISKFVATFTLDPPPGTPPQPTAKSAAPVAQEESQKWDAFSRSIYASACPSLAIPIFQPGPLRAPACASGAAESTHVTLDCKIACKQLPPPPFKGLVKGVMVHKVDCCMLDLVDFHSGSEPTPKMTRRRSQQLSKQRSRNLPDNFAVGASPNSFGSQPGSPKFPGTSPIPESKSVHDGVNVDKPLPAAAAVRNMTRTL